MIKNNKNNKKGFTLAELLIVVAIIGILVAIAIPVFTAQLNKAKEGTDVANARSLYAQLQADIITGSYTDSFPAASETISYNGNTFKFNFPSQLTLDSDSGIVAYNGSYMSGYSWTLGNS